MNRNGDIFFRGEILNMLKIQFSSVAYYVGSVDQRIGDFLIMHV